MQNIKDQKNEIIFSKESRKQRKNIMEQRKQHHYKVDYIESLPEDTRIELIDGKLYDMATPSYTHQAILMFLANSISNYISSNRGECQVIPAPFAVYLDEYNYFEPDISVICDFSKIDDKGCHGAPDWVIEIISPSTSSRDCITKLNKYFESGVRLYWIVNPIQKRVTVWHFINGYSVEYSFGSDIPVDIYPDFSISIPYGIGFSG